MQLSWWKILGILILLYVVIGGLSVPLNPGITDLNPGQLYAGQQKQVTITAYNTHFKTAPSTRIWLKNAGGKFLEAQKVQVLSENKMNCYWDISKNMEGQQYTVVGYNKIDGSFLVPDGIVVLKNESFNEAITPETRFTDVNTADFVKPAGLRFPYRSILNETIRNTFFHVALWMAMFVLYLLGLYHAIQYLRTGKKEHDWWSVAYNKSGILYGILGLITGSLWARFTWGGWWTNDVKLNMAALSMFLYFGYLLLRNSFNDVEARARISASFSIFAFVALIPLVFVIPRLTDSLHPGNGGNPALGGEDLDHTLRLFFYPSILALVLLGCWMAQLKFRMQKLARKAGIYM